MQAGTQAKTDVLHYPRLDTVLMVEAAIERAKEYPNKRQLWQSLPKQMMYQTFNLILNYLEQSGKIIYDKDGAILWIHDPEGVRKILASGLRIR